MTKKSKAIFLLPLLFICHLAAAQDGTAPNDLEPDFFTEYQTSDGELLTDDNLGPEDAGPREEPEFATEPEPLASPTESIPNQRRATQNPAVLDGEPIPQIQRNKNRLDYNYQQGVRMIPHPNAKRGLYRITKDKVYLYRVEKSAQDKASSFRIGFYDPASLGNDGTAFSDVYDPPSGPILLYDYEWQIYRGIGKLGARAGVGLFFANGVGRLETSNEPSREKFTFLVFPVSASAIYRFQYWDNQPIVPFVDGGADVFSFAEFRDDNQAPKFGGSFAAHVAGGASFLLNFLDAQSVLNLDREYGINSVWITAEIRQYFPITSRFDFSATVYNAGLMVEF